MDKAHVAQASFGQGEVLATPLQMALAACAVANGGKIMKPYLVDQVLSYNGAVRREDLARACGCSPSPRATAATMQDLMVQVVKQRHGNRAPR